MSPRLALSIAVLAGLIVASPAALSAQTNQHPFACTDYSQGKVFLVCATGKVEWEYPASSCNDLWVLPNGNLLFNTGHGAREVSRDKQILFDYQSTNEIYACQRLSNGNTFISECNSGRLLEVEPSGRIASEIRLLPEGQDGGHAYMRTARRLANGNYLVTHYGDQVVKEYDPKGTVIRSIPALGGPHSAVRLPNGNTVICNWLGHGQFGKAPHLVEITPAKQVVWSFADHVTMKTISSVQILDISGDVLRGEVFH